MSPHHSERTHVILAVAGLALVLLVLPLSPLLTAAVALTMVGAVLTYLLTSSPVRVVRSRPDEREAGRRLRR